MEVLVTKTPTRPSVIVSIPTMTDEGNSKDDEDTEGLEAAEEEIEEEPGSGAGPGADMDKADPVDSEADEDEEEDE